MGILRGRVVGASVSRGKAGCSAMGTRTGVRWRFGFFFFQAEDGIRDKLVTGVQTCALPIWCCSHDLEVRSAVRGKARVHELAKELGVESKNVLAKLKEMGEFVKSASSTVEAPVARRLKEAFAAGSGPSASSAPKGPSPATASEPKVSAKPMPPRKPAAPAGKPKAPVSMVPPTPVAKPASAHDIEVAAAEARAAALKAEQEAARAAQQAQRDGKPPSEGAPKPSFMPP